MCRLLTARASAAVVSTRPALSIYARSTCKRFYGCFANDSSPAFAAAAAGQSVRLHLSLLYWQANEMTHEYLWFRIRALRCPDHVRFTACRHVDVARIRHQVGPFLHIKRNCTVEHGTCTITKPARCHLNGSKLKLCVRFYKKYFWPLIHK